MTKIDAALHLRQVIGKSKNWGIGWLLRGDDGLVEALRIFDACFEDVTKVTSDVRKKSVDTRASHE